MAIFGRIDGEDPIRSDPVERAADGYEHRRVAASTVLAAGTLACPACDAPVAPGPRPLSPAEGVGCPVCLHTGAVRDFLSLDQPTRPAHVVVRVTARAPAPATYAS